MLEVATKNILSALRKEAEDSSSCHAVKNVSNPLSILFLQEGRQRLIYHTAVTTAIARMASEQ